MVFSQGLSNWEIFNNSLLFKNNRLLFSLLFLDIIMGGQGSDAREQSHDRGISPVRENLLHISV